MSDVEQWIFAVDTAPVAAVFARPTGGRVIVWSIGIGSTPDRARGELLKWYDAVLGPLRARPATIITGLPLNILLSSEGKHLLEPLWSE